MVPGVRLHGLGCCDATDQCLRFCLCCLGVRAGGNPTNDNALHPAELQETIEACKIRIEISKPPSARARCARKATEEIEAQLRLGNGSPNVTICARSASRTPHCSGASPFPSQVRAVH